MDNGYLCFQVKVVVTLKKPIVSSTAVVGNMDVKSPPAMSAAVANGNVTGSTKRFNRSNSLQDKAHAQAKTNALRLRSISISEPQPTKTQPKFSKNSRKSRSGFGRGLPKKGECSAVVGPCNTLRKMYLHSMLRHLQKTRTKTCSWLIHTKPTPGPAALSPSAPFKPGSGHTSIAEGKPLYPLTSRVRQVDISAGRHLLSR